MNEFQTLVFLGLPSIGRISVKKILDKKKNKLHKKLFDKIDRELNSRDRNKKLRHKKDDYLNACQKQFDKGILEELNNTKPHKRREKNNHSKERNLKYEYKNKNNNGHGNNLDGVDSSNKGKGHGGPNGRIDLSGDFDDEISHKNRRKRK